MISYLIAKTNTYAYWFGYVSGVVKSTATKEDKLNKIEWAIAQLEENLDILRERSERK